MSITIDYYINHPFSLPALAEEVNRWLGCSLTPYEGDSNDLFSRFLGMELSLGRHQLENDRQCNFEDYTYELGIRTSAGDAQLRVMQLPVMAFIAYTLYLRMGLGSGMLVYDAQVLLARYETRNDSESGEACLYDVVSGAFVQLPDHLRALRSRLPGYEY